MTALHSDTAPVPHVQPWCPTTASPRTAILPAACSQSLTNTVSTAVQPWCRPGVVSYHRFDGPVILPYGAASVMNRWAQMYDAMTTDIR